MKNFEPLMVWLKRSPRNEPLDLFHANTEPFLRTLVALGYKPSHIVDVGAHMGGWTRSALNLFPKAYYSLFEPQRDLLENQTDLDLPNVRKIYMGVGAKSGQSLFTNNPRRDSSSFRFSPPEAKERGFDQELMPIVSLDDFFGSSDEWPRPDLLKVDAEGLDLEVVSGGAKVIDSCEIVLLEAGVLNKSFQNGLGRTIAHMGDRGFTVFDITDLNRTPSAGALWNVEVAFVKKDGFLDRAINKYE